MVSDDVISVSRDFRCQKRISIKYALIHSFCLALRFGIRNKPSIKKLTCHWTSRTVALMKLTSYHSGEYVVRIVPVEVMGEKPTQQKIFFVHEENLSGWAKVRRHSL